MIRTLLLALALTLGTPAWAQLYVPGGGGASYTPPPACTIDWGSGATGPPAGNTITAASVGANVETTFATPCTLPAYSMPYTVECSAWGQLNIGVTVPNLRGRVFANGTAILDTTSVPGLVSRSGNNGWHAHFKVMVASIAAAGTVDAQGELWAQIGTTQDLPIPVANQNGITLNTSGTIAVTLAATWGNAGSGHFISLRGMSCR